MEGWKNGKMEECWNSTIRQFDNSTMEECDNQQKHKHHPLGLGESIAPAFRPGMNGSENVCASRALALL